MDDEEPIDRSRCWWRGCLKRGTLRELAGHRVLLCPKHAEAATLAVRDAERFEVRWGEWTHEIIARKQHRLAYLRQEYEAASDETEDEWEPPEKDRIGLAIDDAERAIEEMSAGPDRPPIVSVRQRGIAD